MTDLEEAYKTMHNNCGIEVGDKVTILRSAKRHELGWHYTWNDKMNNLVGCVGTVKEDCGERGFLIEFESLNNESWYFPFFVLEIFEKERKKRKEFITESGIIKSPTIRCSCGNELEKSSCGTKEIMVSSCYKCRNKSYEKGRKEGKEVGNTVKRSLGF